MVSALVFLFLWVLALYLGYKFVFLNINQTEKYPERYFDLEEKKE
ncbi:MULTISPECIES: hypothetical protein [Campylobacter]|uniref:Uncharacterized protein n=1 Tax=Campylobacter suis TaxID=2790657 RepID=A0ABM8Q2R7_9BACT|nr:hypothetical protein [Campylobacter suis]CAD7287121.1 hypothetical protein LMG8286_00752 [Campylobacter suis]